MKHESEAPDSPDRLGPDRENLAPGEIDLTGTTEQEDDLADVIGDAIHEAETSGGEIPAWGARTIARALANRISSTDAALHHYAVTGRIDPDKIYRELAEAYTDPTGSPQTRSWVNWLGTYLVNQTPDTDPDPDAIDEAPDEAPIGGSALDKVTHYLRHACREADERGQPISDEDARAIATLLTPLTGPSSAMAVFAETGQVDLTALATECRRLGDRTWRTPEIAEWLPRLENWLSANRSGHLSSEAASPQVEQGLAEHGDAFRAYLLLPDVDAGAGDLLVTFAEFYIGTYPHMDALLDDLTEVRDWEGAIGELAARHGIDGLVSLDRSRVELIAREPWDIVDVAGCLYVFTK
jgi:hypothetical protein